MIIDVDKEVCWARSKRNMEAHSRWILRLSVETEG